jgi:hypothetical protein
LHSGEYHYEETDLTIEGRGFDLVWRRKYRSRVVRSTLMGFGWDFSYNRYVTSTAWTGRFVFDGDSRQDDYRPIGDDASPRRASSGSSVCMDGTYTLTFPNKPVDLRSAQWFARPGRSDGSRTSRTP